MTALNSAAPAEPGSAEGSLRPAGAVRCEVIGDATLYLADSAGCLSVINTSTSAEAKRIIMQDLTPFEQQMAHFPPALSWSPLSTSAPAALSTRSAAS